MIARDDILKHTLVKRVLTLPGGTELFVVRPHYDLAAMMKSAGFKRWDTGDKAIAYSVDPKDYGRFYEVLDAYWVADQAKM